MRAGYKMTKLGEIPLDWEVVKLGDVGEFSKGKGLAKKDLSLIGIPCIRYGEIYTVHDNVIRNFYSYINRKIANNSKKLKKGDILFAGSGETSEDIGKAVAFIDDIEAYAGGDIVILSLDEEFDSVFLAHCLNAAFVTTQRRKYGQGNSVVHIYARDLALLKTTKPPLQEQKKIAQILSTVDEKIDLTQSKIEATQALKKGLMQQLLTKGIGHTEFKESKLGEIPLDWEVVKLEDVSDFSNGKGHEKSINENGRYIVVNSKFISSDGRVKKYSNQNLCPLNKGDIVMVMSDVPNGKAIAKCFLIDKSDYYTLNQRICSIKPYENVDLYFLFYFLNRNRYYLAFDNGVGQTNLRKTEVLACPLPLPPLQEQKKIAEILSKVDEKIDLLVEKKKAYQVMKKGLMQQLLTGQVRVG